MIKAKYIIVVIIITINMMINMMIIMTTTNNSNIKNNTGSANSHVCPAQVSSLQTGLFIFSMP